MSLNSELLNMVPAFGEHLVNAEAGYTDDMTTMQINVGYLCNQACKHCHLEAGPGRSDAIMNKDVMEACIKAYRSTPSFKTIDITGGAPEMNPDFEWLLRTSCDVSDHVIVRTNLTVLDDEEYSRFIDLYKELCVEVCASLPHYSQRDTDRQRGDEVFEKSIRVLKKFSDIGYGRDDALVLDLVYNPGGAFLTPAQDALEREYKLKLKEKFDIDFTHLFTIVNNPVGRFCQFLERSGNLDRYMNTLLGAYNPAAEMGMMCRYQVSVAHDGRVYDCDFNQALGMSVESGQTIFDFAEQGFSERRIVFGNHCYACTAGQGSSCGGATS